MSVHHETHEGITWLTLERPLKRNALTPEMIQSLTQALDHAKDDDQSRVLVLRGQGEHFCAGADLTWMAKMAKASHADSLQDALQLAMLLHTLYHFPKPTMVQVQGATYGGGIGLVAACDMAIASTDATFCFSEVKLGLIPAVISPFVIQAIGQRAAAHLFMTASPFDAATAQSLQLIQHQVAPERLNEHVTAQAHQLATLPPHAVQACKALTRTVAHQAISSSLMEKTALWLTEQRQHPETQTYLTGLS